MNLKSQRRTENKRQLLPFSLHPTNDEVVHEHPAAGSQDIGHICCPAVIRYLWKINVSAIFHHPTNLTYFGLKLCLWRLICIFQARSNNAMNRSPSGIVCSHSFSYSPPCPCPFVNCGLRLGDKTGVYDPANVNRTISNSSGVAMSCNRASVRASIFHAKRAARRDNR